MRERLALLLLMLAASACSWPARGEVWDEVHGATLALGVPGGSCSGTAVGHYTILTAAHCFADDTGKPVKPLSITANGELCEVWRLVDDGNDHVLLTVSGCKLSNRAKIAPHRAITGDQAFVWGNPSFLEDQLRIGRASGYGVLPVGTDDGGILSQRFQFWDLATTYGDSGAAIFNMDGEVVGVVSIGTDPITKPFHLMGSLPLAFTRKQWREATL